jgi:hypothetical protein
MMGRFLSPLTVVAMSLSATPVAAANYSPWADRPRSAVERLSIELVKSKKGSDICCKHCTKGQPCGNSCISIKDKCHKPPGCAC